MNESLTSRREIQRGWHGCGCRAGGSSDFGGPAAAPHYPPDLKLEPVHLDIDLHIDIARQTASGAVTTRVESRSVGARELILDALDFLDLDVHDAGGHAISWRYDGEKIRVRWAEDVPRGDQRELVVRYKVVEPRSGLFFSSPDQTYPDRAVYAATDHETERARHWLPCVDLPSVRTTLAFHLRADASYTILANGRLDGTDAGEDGTKTAHWTLEQRCPSYLLCFAIGEFVTAEDGEFDGRPIAYFCSKEHTPEDLIRAFGRTRPMLEWMTARLDHPFPYPKYYQFALPGFGGAMENISLVSWDDAFVMDETLAREWTWLVDQINVHEMAHSYFGDLVVCRDFAHAWLKESWATYMETCWLEHAKGQDEMRYDLYRNARAYFSEADDSYARPIVTRNFASSWQMYDNHLYPGGGCRLHTLRMELGDETFWAAVSDYIKTNAGQVVETSDFRRVMEKHSGVSLGRFFDQWLHRAGYPNLKVEFSFDEEQKLGSFTVTQKQASKDAALAFELHTEVGWTDSDGVERFAPLHIDGPRASITIPMGKEPAQVRFDPRGKVLHKLEFDPGETMLLAQLKGSTDIVGRIHAAHTLAKKGKRNVVEALRAAYDAEPFWGVRVEIASALSKIAPVLTSAVEALAHAIAAERDDLALVHLFVQAAKIRDTHLADAIAARIDEGDLGYRASAFAYTALGAQRSDAPLERLLSASAETGYRSITQSGALKGLALSRDPKGWSFLLDYIEGGYSTPRSRRFAVDALAQVGGLLEKRERERAIEVLEDRLRDDSDRVRAAAARGLVQMSATSSIAALEAFGATLTKQERVGLDERLSALRAAGPMPTKTLQEELDKIVKHCRKLEDRVQDLESKLEASVKDAAKGEESA